jgi:hypothetical protein
MNIRRITALILFAGLWYGALAQEGSDAPPPPRGGYGRIKIVTTPPQAVAYMGGIKLGSTPIDTAFESGRHTLTLMLNGEELVRERINVWPDSTTLIEKSLAMPYGSLLVKTNPQRYDCTVFMDGEDVGSTRGAPLTINKIRAGTRVFRVSNGRRFKEYTIVIPPEKTVELMADFSAE